MSAGGHGLQLADIGGLPVVGGGRLRTGRVFRISCEMVGPAEIDHLDTHGLKLLIDLRGTDEDRQALRTLVTSRDIGYRHEPITVGNPTDAIRALVREGVTEADGREYVQSVYRTILDEFAGSLAGAVRAIAEVQPVGFGCAAGKDRSGVLTALVQDLLGVDRSVIVDGYVSHAPPVEQLREAFRTWFGEDAAAFDAPGLGAVLGASKDVMLSTLHHLDEHYGGARGYLKTAGVPAQTLDELRRRLVT